MSKVLLGGSDGVVNTLDFYPASIKSHGCFYFRRVSLWRWKVVTVNSRSLHCQPYSSFWRPVVSVFWATSKTIKCIFFPRTRDLLVGQETMQRHFFLSVLHHLSPVILSDTAVLAFVQLRSSRFNLHCYTQREATPAQNSAWKWQQRPVVTFFAGKITRAKELHLIIIILNYCYNYFGK